MLNRIVERTLDGGIPLLVVVVALLMGAFALMATPREEEPQIVVPSADVLIDAPGLSARQVERLVATPLEKLLAQIDGVENVYSTSRSGGAVVSLSFYVGEDREDSLLKLYSKIYSHTDEVPAGVTSWVVKPVEVDDVAILTATLFAFDPDLGGYELRRLAEEIALSLQSVPETNRIEVAPWWTAMRKRGIPRFRDRHYCACPPRHRTADVHSGARPGSCRTARLRLSGRA